MLSYDNLRCNYEALLDLPFEEGTGTITADIAKPHHQFVDLVSPPTWASLSSGLGVLSFDGATNYGELVAADSADLDFTSGAYSIVVWVYQLANAMSRMVLAKYRLDTSGWELYFYQAAQDYLTLRHHHASLSPDRTGCYSIGWDCDTWWCLGITRAAGSAYPRHYRNGVPLVVSFDPGGLYDPDTAVAEDLVIGTRFTKNSDWYKGGLWRPRIFNRELSPSEMRLIYNMEEHWFV